MPVAGRNMGERESTGGQWAPTCLRCSVGWFVYQQCALGSVGGILYLLKP